MTVRQPRPRPRRRVERMQSVGLAGLGGDDDEHPMSSAVPRLRRDHRESPPISGPSDIGGSGAEARAARQHSFVAAIGVGDQNIISGALNNAADINYLPANWGKGGALI